MKVRVKSTGQIIDVPDSVGANIAATKQPVQDQSQQILQSLAAQAMADPKNASKYKSVMDIYAMAYPGESAEEKKKTGELQDSLSGGLTKLGEISSILDEYEGENISGLGPSLKAKLFKGLSREEGLGKSLAPSKGTNFLQAAISDYNTRLFDIAGKAFTGPERDILEGLVLDIADDETRLREKMTQAEQMIKVVASDKGVKLPDQKTKGETQKGQTGGTVVTQPPPQGGETSEKLSSLIKGLPISGGADILAQIAGARTPFPISPLVTAGISGLGQSVQKGPAEFERRLNQTQAGETPGYGQQLDETGDYMGSILKHAGGQALLNMLLSPLKTTFGVRNMLAQTSGGAVSNRLVSKAATQAAGNVAPSLKGEASKAAGAIKKELWPTGGFGTKQTIPEALSTKSRYWKGNEIERKRRPTSPIRSEDKPH